MTIVRGGIVRSRPELVRSIVFSSGGTPPALLSATILADGVTMRLVFDQDIISGSATDGLSRSTGSITSGSYSGVNLDLTIPKVYAGDDAGTISYTPGTLAGDGGAVAAFGPIAITNNSEQVAWTPASISGIYDYGDLTDLSKLKQPDGTTAVDEFGDPVGRWAGHLGAITFAQNTTNNAPAYSASGLQLGLIGGFGKSMAAPYVRAQNLAHALAAAVSSPAGSDFAAFYAKQSGGSARYNGFFSTGGDAYFINRGTNTIVSGIGDDGGDRRLIVRYDGTTGATSAERFVEGTKATNTRGAGTADSGEIAIQNFDGDESYITRWAVVHATISDDDAALLDAWFAEG